MLLNGDARCLSWRNRSTVLKQGAGNSRSLSTKRQPPDVLARRCGIEAFAVNERLSNAFTRPPGFAKFETWLFEAQDRPQAAKIPDDRPY
jgi:hypothetical protein